MSRTISWHNYWDTGNTKGLSFFYYHEACLAKRYPEYGKKLARVIKFTDISTPTKRDELHVVRGFHSEAPCMECGVLIRYEFKEGEES